ncbi:hypothetical protein TNCV_4012371 [Trichonephila clavipes]|nr:hypothetical protein TNCV_4012371 [Trichonephila clavipes]
MESDKQHFRHILLFYRRKGKNTVQARKKLTDVYGEGVLTLLPDITTINSEVYCHQLDKLNDELQQKRSELINRKA